MNRPILIGLASIAALSMLIWWRFDQDMKVAFARAAHGSTLISTRCGTIEYQEAGWRNMVFAL
jgi:hypothetical protein